MSERDPITRQRSSWTPLAPLAIDGVTTAAYQREVGDGRLVALVAEEPDGWHLSISHRRPTRKGIEYVRYPRWDEIAAARDEFLPADLSFVMVLPAAGEYVAEHKTTFHLHELNRRLVERERGVGGPGVRPDEDRWMIDGVAYRKPTLDDPDDLLTEYGTILVPVDPEAVGDDSGVGGPGVRPGDTGESTPQFAGSPGPATGGAWDAYMRTDDAQQMLEDEVSAGGASTREGEGVLDASTPTAEPGASAQRTPAPPSGTSLYERIVNDRRDEA